MNRLHVRRCLLFTSALLLGAGPVSAQTPGRAPGPGQRVVLVTGSTSGLGREVARSMAEDGHHVIVHGRNAERGAALVAEINGETSGSARFYRADFASLENVRELAAAIVRDYERLDVLVNNAGVLGRGGERSLTEDGYEFTFQVNYLAGFLLTDLLLPVLEESAPSRIVNVSSIAESPLDFDDLMMESGYSGGRAYGQSKLAQIMYTTELARRLEESGVVVTALHPATYMDTNMVVSAGIEPRSSVMEGRDNVLALIDGPVESGSFYVDGEPARPRTAQARDQVALARLWDVTRRLVGR